MSHFYGKSPGDEVVISPFRFSRFLPFLTFHPSLPPFLSPASYSPRLPALIGGPARGEEIWCLELLLFPSPLPLIHHKPKCKYKQQQETLKQESDFNLQEYIPKKNLSLKIFVLNSKQPLLCSLFYIETSYRKLQFMER